MISIRFLEFLLLLLFHQVYSEEAEPVFRAEGTTIEMGYCFGVDYIAVYRCAPEGDQLLGNSSADSTPIIPPVDFHGRIHINKNEYLLGLQIIHLTHKDSGIYRRECWQNQRLVSQHAQQLFVCDMEVESEEIIVKEKDGGAELLCNNTSIGLEGVSVRWYYEMHPSYTPTLFLDTSMFLDPVVKKLQGVMDVRDNGALLLIDNSTLKNYQHFTCLVSKGKNCLSFQNMHLPDRSETRNIFASRGDRVVLKCPADGNNQQWDTPLGRINGSRLGMNISRSDKSKDFSLIIPAFSDEHSGDYSCISSSLDLQFLLVLCPKKESQQKVVVEGGSVLLQCDIGKNDSQGVQWHRQEPSGEHELIHNSADKTVPIPEGLRGRLTLSENGSWLTISHVEVKDQGVYWCVVLTPEFLEEEDDYEAKDDYEEEDAAEDEFDDGLYWDDAHRCIFKQETILSLTKATGRGNWPPNRPPETSSTETGPTASTNVTTYAVVGGLVALLVVGVIVAVIAIKKRRREAASHTGLNTTNDTKMDPGCTQSLTHNDEYGV